MNLAGTGQFERSIALFCKQIEWHPAIVAVVIKIQTENDGLFGKSLVGVRNVFPNLRDVFGVPSPKVDHVQLGEIGVDVLAVQIHRVDDAPDFQGIVGTAQKFP